MAYLETIFGSPQESARGTAAEIRFRQMMEAAAIPMPSPGALVSGPVPIPHSLVDALSGYHPANIETRTPTLAPIKKSIKEIEAEPFESGARKRIEGKIGRLQSAGAVAQATILEEELRTRDSLIRLKEWDYKILTKEAVDKFQTNNQMTQTRDGLKIHIDQLDKYCGNPQAGEAKDRIMPDSVLDKLEEAKTRVLFDDYAVLWAEKVKDPLLLGIVYGCKDYFFICEWGDDISFDQIMKKSE